MPGERCEIAGVGPVSMTTLRSLLPEAFVAVVINDSVDVCSVAHAGRQVTAHQRSALEARGYWCGVPGCGSRHRLEIDHIAGWANTGRTRLDDLAWLCTLHHRAKTHHGWTLTGPPGRRDWTRPITTVGSNRSAPPGRPATAKRPGAPRAPTLKTT